MDWALDKPDKAMQRQQAMQDKNQKRLAFKMRCNSCQARLVKRTFMVPNPVPQNIRDFYKGFYAHPHYCAGCGEGDDYTLDFKTFTDMGAIPYRGRGG